MPIVVIVAFIALLHFHCFVYFRVFLRSYIYHVML
jgi:hypothetical protein